MSWGECSLYPKARPPSVMASQKVTIEGNSAPTMGVESQITRKTT